jgi:hypothetical protein
LADVAAKVQPESCGDAEDSIKWLLVKKIGNQFKLL